MQVKVIVLVVVSVVIAVLLATAVGSFTRVPDAALAEVASPGATVGAGSSRPFTAGKNYLPIIFMNSATAGGAWLLAGNAGTDWATDFLGTTDNMTLTLRVSNTVAYRIVPAVDPFHVFAPNLVGGPPSNGTAPGVYGATIGGGSSNAANANRSTVSGGYLNTTSGQYATIAGGWQNFANGNQSTVSGGYINIANGRAAFIGGGESNIVSGTYATVAGGNINSAGNDYATIGGGEQNIAIGADATVGGGSTNAARADYATVSGGAWNATLVTSTYASIGGGQNNVANGPASTVAGGMMNSATGLRAAVGGGMFNTASGDFATMGGGAFNSVKAYGGTVSGGTSNTASSGSASIGGGEWNTSNGYASTVSGGGYNKALGYGASVSGGSWNSATVDYASVGGGWTNRGNGMYSVVGGGFQNTANGNSSAIAGGYMNSTGDAYSTVAGGFMNQATGYASLAAGNQARAAHWGSFVWADSSGTPITSTIENQFLVRATGGISMATSANLSTGCSISMGGGAWACTSNKNVKANFADVDTRAILERVSDLPISTWNFKTQDASIRHIGPMAQDFYAAFNVGENDTTISTVDAQGVALAAIQGLAKENKELKEKNDNLETRLAALESRSPSADPFSVPTLAPWAVVGLLAVWMMRKRTYK